ncbi:alanine racemase [Marinifilum fragile]|uniref:alanine racemase n=1 Tax=Marinifilum fragile TaxID=570161 RepID=UPI002AAB234D|nr:alanine racemase [Marinifilum fragile]
MKQSFTKPTLLLDECKCRENIKTMALKAKQKGLIFRPHFKTHQSLEVGEWYKELGVDKITVSSLEMAEYFSSEWNDITVAFPVNILEIDTINSLAKKITLNLLIESKDAALFLKENVKYALGIFIKIDVGYNRVGVKPDNTHLIEEILEVIDASESLKFSGFLAHAGHTYNCISKEEILQIHEKAVRCLHPLKLKYESRYPDSIISYGDTPSCSVAENFEGIDEIRPGNFVFYDLAQVQIGSTTIDYIAVAVVCPIVAIYKERKEIVIYGGGVHFSKDCLEDEHYGAICGKVVERDQDKWGNEIPGMYLKKLSQEHGIVHVPDSEIDNYKLGDCLTILPVHACMTANELKSYYIAPDKTILRL